MATSVNKVLRQAIGWRRSKRSTKTPKPTSTRPSRRIEDTPQGRRKGEELRKACHKGEADRFLTAVDIAKADPKSDVGFAALEWVTKAVDQLLKDIR